MGWQKSRYSSVQVALEKAVQAYKVKGRIDAMGHLIISEAIDLAPGEVEVIV